MARLTVQAIAIVHRKGQSQRMNQPLNKQMRAADVVANIKSGMTIGIGGWGPRRKPMALVCELLRSDVRDLTIVAYGGHPAGAVLP